MQLVVDYMNDNQYRVDTGVTPQPSNQLQNAGKRQVVVHYPSLDLGKPIIVEVATGKRLFDLQVKEKEYGVNKESKTADEEHVKYQGMCKVVSEFSNLTYEEVYEMLGQFEVMDLYMSIRGDSEAMGKLLSLTSKK